MGKAVWESRFDRWAVGLSTTEQEKCDRAERMVKAAIDAHDGLRSRNIKVFPQGSYRNRTNVRLDSDVDICVLAMDTFYGDFDHVPGVTYETLDIGPGTYHFPELKRDVEEALVAKFGRDAVTLGDKAFDIKDNTYRVSADVVATFEGRTYYKNGLGGYSYHSGTALQSNSTRNLIWNFPEQHYTCGVAKHTATRRQFKKRVRCLKNLCNHMSSQGITSADKMASFLLESLVYNCTSGAFTQYTHYEGVKEVVRQMWHATQTDEACGLFLEVSERKYLFHPTQPWNRADVHRFLDEAWYHVGFGQS